MNVLAVLDTLDPLLLKNKDHLNEKDLEVVEAYERRVTKRVETLAERCNFFELMRNRQLFSKERFLGLINESILKTAKNKLPDEFSAYAAKI